jgi:hypothetical protein
VNDAKPFVGSIVVDHGISGIYARFIGWWLLPLVGLAAVSLLPISLASYARQGVPDWSRFDDVLAWFGFGLCTLYFGVRIARARDAFAAVLVVDDAGIVIKPRDGIDQHVRWQQITHARIDLMLAQIRFTASTHTRPIMLMNGAAPYWRFRAIRAVVENRVGGGVTIVSPSVPVRLGAMVCGLSVFPKGWSRLAAGDWGGLVLLAGCAVGLYFAATGMARFYKPVPLS